MTDEEKKESGAPTEESGEVAQPAAPVKPAPAVRPPPIVKPAPAVKPPPVARPPAAAGASPPAAAKPAPPVKPPPAAASGPPKDAVVTTGTVKPREAGSARAAGAAGTAAAAAAPGPKSLQPAAPSGPQPLNISRRSFFSSLGIAWVSFTGAMGAALTATARFMFPNVLFEPPMSFKAGYPSDYAIGMVDERWKEKFGTWIFRQEDGLYALSTTCTHLGCTPNWLGAENKFKCPCHGSGFYPSGINFEGPAPRPLERYKITLGDDGQIVIDKNQIYQQEKGQWEDPSAFLRFTG